VYADSSRRQNKRVGYYVVAGVWGGGIALSPENFSILSLKMATFSACWALAHVARGHGLPPLRSASGR